MVSPQAQTILDLAHSGLPLDQIRARIEPLQPYMQEALDAGHAEIVELQSRIGGNQKRVDILKDLESWIMGPAKLERNEHTRVHRLVEASQRKEVMNASDGGAVIFSSQAFAAAQVFVVRHDWAGALGPAIEAAGGGISLPYDWCVFEFMMSGRCVVIFAVQAEDGRPKATPFVETKHGWWCGDEDDVAEGTPFHAAWLQIVAICVALDAEVATKEVVRAPVALNNKRERSGKPLLKDFHVVDLARRHRVAGPATGTHRSPRLHFRRGHWRHYEEHKTWIKWMLVGNPDLGFVEKNYRV